MFLRDSARLALLCALALTACDSDDPSEADDDGSANDGDGDGDGDDDDGGTPDDDGPARRFFLPTDEPTNTSAPTLLLDDQGGLHAVYPAYVGGDAFYAFCPAGCTGPDDMSVVRLPTDGTVGNAMIALDREGRPQLLLSTYLQVYYATCSGDCTDPGAWTTTAILDHQGDREVTGQAFALDPEGRPRFLMHTYVAFLGIGQEAPETHWVTCDADCHEPAQWSAHLVADQIWQSSHVRIDDQGRVRLATVATIEGTDDAPSQDAGAYAECDAGCEDGDEWIATGLAPAYSSQTDAVTIDPAIALALTDDGRPRVALLSQDDAGNRNLVYMACDEACATSPWQGVIISDSEHIGAGLDLELDADGHPRLAYTIDYNIGVAYCDQEPCHADLPTWDLAEGELGSDMPPDEIFPYPNCDVAAWFLHSPSLVLTPEGRPRVGYQARDISGGWDNPNPGTEPDCVAGTDMTWARLAILPGLGDWASPCHEPSRGAPCPVSSSTAPAPSSSMPGSSSNAPPASKPRP